MRFFEISKKRHKYDSWIEVARSERSAKGHAVLLSEEPERELPLLTAVETKDAILRGNLNARANVVYLSHRCRKYGRELNGGLNAIAEELYDESVRLVEALPSSHETSEIGTLHGIPISVKEHICVKGCYSSGGLACRLKARNEQDSLMVQVVKEAGALPLVTGNVTQIMMLPESVNRIWGRSCNPWDPTRTPGGSSGGDAALVASGCVPLAVGSDVAGSIRIPASFCGVVGFKPTSTRVSGKGIIVPRRNNKSGTSILIPTVIGPITRSVDDCALFMKAILVPRMFQEDLNVPPLPFNDSLYQCSDRLRIGYFDTDGWFEPCASVKRAIRQTVESLRKEGHTCVPFKPPTDGWHSYGLLVAINAAEGDFFSFTQALEGEQPIPEYNTLLAATRLSNPLRWLACKLVDKRRAHLLSKGRAGGIRVRELWQHTAALAEMRQLWADAFKDDQLDAVIHPSMPLPAFKHGTSGDLTSACSYVFLANMLIRVLGKHAHVAERSHSYYHSRRR